MSECYWVQPSRSVEERSTYLVCNVGRRPEKVGPHFYLYNPQLLQGWQFARLHPPGAYAGMLLPGFPGSWPGDPLFEAPAPVMAEAETEQRPQIADPATILKRLPDSPPPRRASDVGLGIAARLWCEEGMSHCVMDIKAAEEIALIVDRVRGANAKPTPLHDPTNLTVDECPE